MWLFTKYGFFSIVQDRNDSRRVLVRARIRNDLERLLHLLDDKCDGEAPEVVEMPDADYAFRIFLDKAAWAKVAKVLANDIDYGNFKNAVHGEPDRDQAYMEVWSSLSRLQEDRLSQ